MNDITKQALTDKINSLTQSVWGCNNSELLEIVYKINTLQTKLNLIK